MTSPENSPDVSARPAQYTAADVATGPYDQTVYVTLQLDGATPSFTFAPDTIDMQGPGTITFRVGTGGTAVPFQFVGFRTDPASGEFAPTYPGGIGGIMTVADTDSDTVETSYDYYVTVQTVDGTRYESDPKIVNMPE